MRRSTLVAIIMILAVGTLSLNYLLLQFEDEWKPNGSESVPQTVVSTSPAITEMLFALGVQERIVGVTDFCTFPPFAQSLPKIGVLICPARFDTHVEYSGHPQCCVQYEAPESLPGVYEANLQEIVDENRRRVEVQQGSSQSLARGFGNQFSVSASQRAQDYTV